MRLVFCIVLEKYRDVEVYKKKFSVSTKWRDSPTV